MAKVVFPDHLQKFTRGVKEIDVPCTNFRNLLRELNSKWPGIEEVLEETAVAIVNIPKPIMTFAPAFI